ncbi:MAG TPA: NADH pyrophosphatase zinc ribbon domain-containing protein, partial [Usitatibacter sp.]|nr:NADH pyrophosphatase zinc ribbon domain-containing protein [Usitatibacter sp.]
MIKTPPGFRASLEPVPGLPIRTFAFRGTDLLVRESDHAVPEAAEVEPLVEDPSRLIPVGAHGGIYYQSTWLAGDAAPPGGFKFTGLRRLFGHADDTTLALGGRAFQLADWARSHRFCGACGSPAARVPGERAMRCACGHTAYPRISPAMMVLVRRGPAILLARNAAVPAGGRMSALAGFLEA